MANISMLKRAYFLLNVVTFCFIVIFTIWIIPEKEIGFQGIPCSKSLGMHYLTSDESWRLRPDVKMCKTAKCHFINGTNRSSIALISYPGSGNTWVRGLLEKSTGICTGSAFHDTSLKREGMIGEGITSGSVLLVKLHGHLQKGRHDQFKDVVLMIRNPYDTLISEWNRRSSPQKLNHTAIDPRDKASVYTRRSKNITWDKYVIASMRRWYHLYNEVISKGLEKEYPLLIVRYEDFITDRRKEIEKILKFIHFSYNTTLVREQLETDFDLMKRKHTKKKRNPFTPLQIKGLNTRLHDLENLLERCSLCNKTNLKDYYKLRFR